MMPTPSGIELSEKPVCACERCKTLHTLSRAHLVDLLEQQVRSEAIDTLTTRDHYRDAALLAAAQAFAKWEVLEEVEAEALRQYREQVGPMEWTNAQKLQVAAGAFREALDVIKARYAATAPKEPT